jgi:hypothetical protein
MTILVGLLTNAQIVGTLMSAQPSPMPLPNGIGLDSGSGSPRLAYADDLLDEAGMMDAQAVSAPRLLEPSASPESASAELPAPTTQDHAAQAPVLQPSQSPVVVAAIVSESKSAPLANSGSEMSAIAAQIALLRQEMVSQRVLIEAQAKIIAAQQDQLRQLAIMAANNATANQAIASAAESARTNDETLAEARGAGYGTNLAGGILISAQAPAEGGVEPNQPVGVAPPPAPTVQSLVEAVPEGQGVLTPAGRFVLDTSFEYTNSSTNRLVFRGFELIPGLQVGLIEASDVDRDTIVGTIAGRYGLTRRLEIEARMPVMYRSDRIEVAQQREESIVRTIKLNEYNIGDAELSLRYQLNAPKVPNKAIWIASLRVKSDTGKSPFEVIYDDFGVATGLATGSGFWAAQPGISFLLPSDPVVIYGGGSYLYHIARDIDRQVGNALIGRVNPGDAINANIGFGFALNQKFSFSLGYRHSYLFPSKTEIGNTLQKSNHLQVGSLGFGMSYRLSSRQSINFGVELGATADAPNVSAVLRLPLSF